MTPPSSPWVYKIAPAADWAAVPEGGRWSGTDLDHRDGFLHLSAPEQVAGTLERHYAGQAGLVLLWVRAAALPDLRWEPSRDGALFPHLYGPLERASVDRADPLPLEPSGRHRLPPDLPPATAV